MPTPDIEAPITQHKVQVHATNNVGGPSSHPVLRIGGLSTPDQRHIGRTDESNELREDAMQITRNTIETTRGPSEWFTGAVYIDTIATPSEPSRLSASSVPFTPGARTAWHTHPNGQTIYVTEGLGLCQRRGGEIEVIRPGDRVFFEPGEDHWHGAAPNRFMTHIAMQEVDDQGSPVTWGEHVSDEEYSAAPSIDR
jgi:quercetin dioxygenase-like cupin family protein